MSDIDFDSAVNVLAHMPGPDEVAALLEEKGVTGLPRSAYSCPIAEALNAVVSDGRVAVTQSSIKHVSSEWETVSVWETPPVIASFIRLFDRGLYPALRYHP